MLGGTFQISQKKCPETQQMIWLVHLCNLNSLRIFTFCLLSKQVCLFVEELQEVFNLNTKFPFLVPGKLSDFRFVSQEYITPVSWVRLKMRSLMLSEHLGEPLQSPSPSSKELWAAVCVCRMWRERETLLEDSKNSKRWLLTRKSNLLKKKSCPIMFPSVFLFPTLTSPI